MGIYTPTEGEIYFKDFLISEKRSYREHKKDIQRNMQVIFQDSAAALNPRMKVADIIAEPLVINRVYPDKVRLRAEVDKLLTLVGLDTSYGNQVSGRDLRRATPARRHRPQHSRQPRTDRRRRARCVTRRFHTGANRVPLSALARQHGFTFLFIAHDLSMVRYLCDRVGVMYEGRLVELAPAKELFGNPLHPYTRALLSAIPVPDPVYERSKKIIPYTHETADLSGEWREILPEHFLLARSE